MKRFIVVLAIILLAISQEAAADTPEEAIAKGEASYLAGDYTNALNAFQSAAKEKENGYLFYNIGNCYYRLQQKGLALGWYRKAEKLTPEFPDLRANIALLEKEKGNEPGRPVHFGMIEALLPFHESLSARQATMGAVLFFGVFSLLFFLYLKRARRHFFWQSLLFLFLSCTLGASASVRYYEEVFLPFGVIIEPYVEVRSERNENAVPLFKINEATEFDLLDTSPTGWLYIGISGGKRGWIPKTSAFLP